LFGVIGAAGTVENFSLVNISVTGSSASGASLGAIAGENDGAITNMSITAVGKNTGSISYVSTESSISGGSGDVTVAGGSSTWIGGFVGDNSATGNITQSSTGAGLVSGGTGYSYVGGFAGQNDGVISMGSGVAPVTSSAGNLGGFAGRNTGAIDYGSAGGAVSYTGTGGGNSAVGGLVGLNTTTGSIDTAFSTSTVAGGAAAAVGGFVGAQQGTIAHAGESGGVTTTGAGSATTYEGGFAGVETSGGISVAYANGAVTTTAASNVYVGGFIGSDTSSGAPNSISQSYSSGYVFGPAGAVVGGFAGYVAPASPIAASYYVTDTSGQANAAPGASLTGVAGQTTAQFEAGLASGLTDSDWAIVDGESFTYLGALYNGTPQVVSGFAYTAYNSNPANLTPLAGASVSGFANGVQIGDGGNLNIPVATAGANGYYVLLAAPGTLTTGGQAFTYIATGNSLGNALQDVTTGSVNVGTASGATPVSNYVSAANLTLYGGGTLRLESSATGSSNFSTLVTEFGNAIGGNTSSQFLVSNSGFTGSTLDIEFATDSNTFAINQELNISGATLVLDNTSAYSASPSTKITQADPIIAGSVLLLGNERRSGSPTPATPSGRWRRRTRTTVATESASTILSPSHSARSRERQGSPMLSLPSTIPEIPSIRARAR
jgi:hypothetical protein